MQVDRNVLGDIEDHSKLLRLKFDSIFPAEKVTPSWIQNLFLVNINDVEENFQEEIVDQKASDCKYDVRRKQSNEFWLTLTEVSKHFSKIALNHLLPFSTTYL